MGNTIGDTSRVSIKYPTQKIAKKNLPAIMNEYAIVYPINFNVTVTHGVNNGVISNAICNIEFSDSSNNTSEAQSCSSSIKDKKHHSRQSSISTTNSKLETNNKKLPEIKEVTKKKVRRKLSLFSYNETCATIDENHFFTRIERSYSCNPNIPSGKTLEQKNIRKEKAKSGLEFTKPSKDKRKSFGI